MSVFDASLVKTTDENLTSENWELILNLCDKVNDEGQEGCAPPLMLSIDKNLIDIEPTMSLPQYSSDWHIVIPMSSSMPSLWPRHYQRIAGWSCTGK